MKQTTGLDDRKKESFKIFDDIAGTYDPLNRVLSMGIDVRWRNKMTSLLPKKAGLRILDLATGTADVPLTLIKDPRVTQIRGIDMSQGMIDIGKVKIKEKNLQEKIVLDIDNGCDLKEADKSWDVTTVSFGIRNFPDCSQGLMEMNRVLVDGGQCMIMEFSLPTNSIIRAFYLFYFRRVLPFIGNLFSGHGDAYSYLNKTVEEFPYGEDFLALMRKAGFKEVKAYPLTFGIATIYTGIK